MLLVCPKTNVIWSPRCYQIRLRSPFGISWESEFWPLLTSHVAWSWWQAQVNNEDFVDISQAFQVCTLLLLHDDMRTYTHMCYAALNNDKNDKLWRSRRIGIKASCQAHVIFKDYLIESLILKSFLEFAMRCHISLYHFSTWWRLPILKLMYPFFFLTLRWFSSTWINKADVVWKSP